MAVPPRRIARRTPTTTPGTSMPLFEATAPPVIMRPITQLTVDKANPRKPDAARLGLLLLSLSKLGFLMPVYVLRSTGMLLSGHQRLSQAKLLGLTHMPVVEVDLKPEQVPGVNILFNRRLAIHEPVATPTGWRPIGDIRTGDSVMGRDGSAYLVTKTTPHELREMYRVSFDDGESILADAEHLWEVEYTGRSQTKYVQSAVLSTADIQRMLQVEHRRLRVPRIAPLDLAEKSLPVDPWLLGSLIGDGSWGHHRVCWRTSAPAAWALAKIRSALGSWANLSTPHKPGKSVVFIGITESADGARDSLLVQQLQQLELFDKSRHERFVPESYLWGSKEQRLALLQGLMDSDGCVGPHGVTPIFTTTSESLAKNVSHLVFSLGGKAGHRCLRAAAGNLRAIYQVTVRLPEGLVPFTRPDRVAAFVGGDHRLHRRIADVQPAGEYKACCISIDSWDHLYLARGFIPTHNTTNDLGAFDTGAKVQRKLDMESILAAAEALPDFTGHTHPFATNCKLELLAPLLADKAELYDKKGVNAAGAIGRMGIQIPLVVSQSGRIVNGIQRGFHAAQSGMATYPVVRIPDDMAEVASQFLNYLSMDFAVDDDFAVLLRHGAYRRPQNNRGILPKAMRFWANGEKVLQDKDSYTPSYFSTFREIHGNHLIDFGAGLGKVAPYLNSKGFDVLDFEPYRIDPESDVGVPSPDYSRRRAREFLETIADPKLQIDSIFLNSVLNSIPFAQDRLMVLAIVHAIAGRSATVYGTCRDISDFNYEYQGIRQANYFTFDSEPGVRIGDVMSRPKLQKFHSFEEAKEMFGRFWNDIEFWPGGNVFYFRLRAAKVPNFPALAKSLRFEFNMPYLDKSTMCLADLALQSFAKRLSFPGLVKL